MDGDRLTAAGEDADEIARQAERQNIGGEARDHIVGAKAHGDDRHREPDRRAADKREDERQRRRRRTPMRRRRRAKAPASIMPSSPTAKTPARSDKMPPSAASRSGVAMRMAAARNSIMRGGLWPQEQTASSDPRSPPRAPKERRSAAALRAIPIRAARRISDAGTTASGSIAPSNATVTALNPKPREKPSISRR